MDESGESDFQGAQIKTVMYIVTIWRDFLPKIGEKEISLEFYN